MYVREITLPHCACVYVLLHVHRIPMTVINIFTKSDSVAALIWASALACVVAMVMLLIQRIVTLEEYMQVSKTYLRT